MKRRRESESQWPYLVLIFAIFLLAGFVTYAYNTHP